MPKERESITAETKHTDERKAVKATVENIFPTPVVQMLWPDTEALNAALKLDLMSRRIKDPVGIYRSNTSSTWHSDTTLFHETKEQKRKAANEALFKMFGRGFNQLATQHGVSDDTTMSWRLQSWGMIYSDRGYATPHNHPNCHFAGVYYVDAGDDGSSPEKVMATGVRRRAGDLEFIGPHAHSQQAPKGLNLMGAYKVTPKPGLMVLFPAWLNHFVHPVDLDEGETRIAISCNATCVKLEANKKEPKSG